MNLSNMSSQELRQLQEQLKRELKRREGLEKQQARERILAIAQTVGLPLRELIGAPPRGKGGKPGKVAARYRNPADASQQWTGRGRQPLWVKHWVDAGKPIDAIRI